MKIQETVNINLFIRKIKYKQSHEIQSGCSTSISKTGCLLTGLMLKYFNLSSCLRPGFGINRYKAYEQTPANTVEASVIPKHIRCLNG